MNIRDLRFVHIIGVFSFLHSKSNFFIIYFLPQPLMEAKSPVKKQSKLFTCQLPGIHEDELLNLVCVSCKYKLCCPICMRESHVGHHFEPLKVVIAEILKTHQKNVKIESQTDINSEATATKIKQLEKLQLLVRIKNQLDYQIQQVRQFLNYHFFKTLTLNQINTQNYQQLKNSLYQTDSIQKFQRVIRLFKQIPPENFISNKNRNYFVQCQINSIDSILSSFYEKSSKIIRDFREVRIQLQRSSQSAWDKYSSDIHNDQGKFTITSRSGGNTYYFALYKYPMSLSPERIFDFIYLSGQVMLGLCFESHLGYDSKIDSSYMATYEFYGIQINQSTYFSSYDKSTNPKIQVCKLQPNRQVSLAVNYQSSTVEFRIFGLQTRSVRFTQILTLNLFFAGKSLAKAAFIGTR